MTEKDKNNLLIALGIGAGVHLLTRQTQPPSQSSLPAYQGLPPEPPRTRAAEWYRWAKNVMDLYGRAKGLWKPGGPFYNGPSAEEILSGFSWATRGF